MGYKYGDAIKEHGFGDDNDRGDKLIEWAEMKSMIIESAWYKQHTRCLWRWRNPGKDVQNQSDHILILKRYNLHC